MPRLILAALAVFLAPALVAASPAAQTCSTSWTNAAGGAWTTAANWSSGVPTATSDACIVLAGTYSVTVAGFAVNRLTLGGAAGSGAQTLVNTGDVSFAAAGTVAASGVLEWRDGYVRSGTLTNTGLVRLDGNGANRGVLPSAGATAVFRNTGTVRHLDTRQFYVYGGGATTTARAENAGLWDLQADGSLLAGFSGTGLFVNEAAGTFRKSAGTATSNVNGALTFDNAGTVEAQTGTLQFDVPSSHTAATLTAAAGATLNLFGPLTFTGAISGSPAGTVRVRDNLTIGAGTMWAFTGNGITWQDGYVRSGTLTNTGLVRLDGGGGNRGVLPSAGATAVFRNTGTVRHLDTRQFYVYGGGATTTARAENAGLWRLESDGALLAGFSGTGLFVNEAAGLFEKSAGFGTANVNGALTFDNAGTVEALSGTLQFDVPSSHTSAMFNVANTATLNLFGPLTFTGTVSGIAAGTLRVRADITAGAGATWAFTISGITWQDGYVRSGTLTNTGLVRFDGGGGNRGVLPTPVAPATSATAVFRNTGTVRHLDTRQFYIYGGSATTTARAENAGLWDLQTDGALLAGFSGTATFVNEAAGTFRKSAGTGTSNVNGALTFENAGLVEVLSGTLSADVPFAHRDGARIAGTATFAKTAPASFLHDGDTAPGTPTATGVLLWTGTYTPTALAAFVVDLGGTTAGSGHDQIAINGAATLAGALDLRVPAGAVLAVGNTFTVLRATSVAGTFGSVVEARGYDFTVAYTSTTVVVTLTRINRAPVVASFDGPATGIRGTALTFTASASDADGQPLTYTYAFGDGTPAQSGVGLTSTSHTFAAAGTYTLTLTVDDLDGGTATATRTVVITVPVAGEDDAAPAVFAVSASPNPARSAAAVTVAMPAAGEVRVEAFDALGRRVALLHDGPLAAGLHALRLDASALPAGVYVVRATAGAAVVARRLTVVR